ncbi:MAG: NADH-quinone oxidoreductase subunit C, partial [Rhodospirillales bacterium]|nr:NADH-quinone oxidoreductase subunit C [Rhodospirillales bacterium]
MSTVAMLRAGRPQPCHPWPRHLLTPEAWRAMAESLAAAPTPELLALWADTVEVHALFRDMPDGGFILASVPVTDGQYPALSPHRPAAAWFERMIRDLWGHGASGGTDARPWLDHGKWVHPAPLSVRPPAAPPAEPPGFLPVEAEGVHVLAVGPIHAGIIEPGHFHFTAQGETVVRLETRRGYLHKGTLGLMRGKSPRAAARFAARLSGDSTVAHSLAFAHAAEAATFTDAPPRARALRAVMAELERVANHLGDCGAIIGDAGFALPPTRFSWHREAMLRAAFAAFGHRLMMDAVIPGGVAA